MEPAMRFELMTSSLPRRRSTPELRGRAQSDEAGKDEQSYPRAIHPYRVHPSALLWSGRRDSNSRPSAWKADALPTELHPPILRSQISHLKFVSRFKTVISNLKSEISTWC